MHDDNNILNSESRQRDRATKAEVLGARLYGERTGEREPVGSVKAVASYCKVGGGRFMASNKMLKHQGNHEPWAVLCGWSGRKASVLRGFNVRQRQKRMTIYRECGGNIRGHHTPGESTVTIPSNTPKAPLWLTFCARQELKFVRHL